MKIGWLDKMVVGEIRGPGVPTQSTVTALIVVLGAGVCSEALASDVEGGSLGWRVDLVSSGLDGGFLSVPDSESESVSMLSHFE